MPTIIRIDTNKVGAKVQTAWDDGLPELAEEILADCNEYCKEDSHALIDSSIIHSRLKQGILVWMTPYAKRQYWEIKTSLTPGRTWKWCETAKRRFKDRWKTLAERGLRRHL